MPSNRVCVSTYTYTYTAWLCGCVDVFVNLCDYGPDFVQRLLCSSATVLIVRFLKRINWYSSNHGHVSHNIETKLSAAHHAKPSSVSAEQEIRLNYEGAINSNKRLGAAQSKLDWLNKWNWEDSLVEIDSFVWNLFDLVVFFWLTFVTFRLRSNPLFVHWFKQMICALCVCV